MRALAAIALVLRCATASAAPADDGAPVLLRDLHPAAGVGQNLAASVAGWRLALHGAAVASTVALAASGGDTAVHDYLYAHDGLGRISTPAVYLVYALPVAVGGAFAAVGIAGGTRREVAAGSAVFQATALTLVYQGVLKGLTGRPNPEPVRYGSDGASQTFRFGLLRGGVHYGWPSGHLQTTSAVLASLLPLYPRSLALRVGGGALFAYVLASVAAHDRNGMHWASDIVAGSLMGYAVGSAVGEGFARRLGADAGAPAPAEITAVPLLGDVRGLALRGRF